MDIGNIRIQKRAPQHTKTLARHVRAIGLAVETFLREARTWIHFGKLSPESKTVLGLGPALVVLAIAAWWNAAGFRSTNLAVEHTHDVLSQLEQASTEILAMHARVRGFLLTGSEEMLEPYHASSARLTDSLSSLRRLAADDPRQQTQLSHLEPLALLAREIMQRKIEARRSRGLSAAADMEADIERAVKGFRAIAGEMSKAERALLVSRMARAENLGRLTVFAIVCAGVLGAGFVILAARVVRRDLRRRQETETALQESFARADNLYNCAPCGYLSLDEAGTFVAINDTALQWLGYKREEVLLRMRFTDILTPESKAAFLGRFSLKRDGTVSNVEYEWCRRNGTRFPVRLNEAAVRDPAGKYVASRATVFDMTERNRVEAQLDHFFSLSRDLLCIAGTDGFFRRISPAWKQTLGHTHDEMMSRPFTDFIHPDDIERTQEEMERLAAGHETNGFENRYRCKDGSYRWLHWNARPAPAERLIYASAHDVTDQRNQAQGIPAHTDLATQLEAVNGELESSGCSVLHDLRTPLRHIDSVGSLLTKRSTEMQSPEGRRHGPTISQSAKEIGVLIDDLLAFSRFGRTPLCIEAVRHAPLVAEVIASGRYASRAIDWQVAPLPQTQGDTAMLRQVWANLIENAVKYSSKVPTPRIVIASREDSETGETVFFVRDNGVGFDMADADKLFGVFQRLHRTSDFDGNGIGLANVRRIVTRHGGRAWAEARVDEGATFYFSLPHVVSTSGSCI